MAPGSGVLKRMLVGDFALGGEPGGDVEVRLVAVFGRGDDGDMAPSRQNDSVLGVVARRRREQEERWRRTDMRRLRRRQGVGLRDGDEGAESSAEDRGSLVCVTSTSWLDIRMRVRAGVGVRVVFGVTSVGRKAGGVTERKVCDDVGRVVRTEGVGVVMVESEKTDLRSRSRFSCCAAAIWSRKGCKVVSCERRVQGARRGEEVRNNAQVRDAGNNGDRTKRRLLTEVAVATTSVAE